MGGEAAKPPLGLERYATLNAEIEAGEMLATVLERESIPKETWLSAQAFWMARMAEEATGRRFETTTRYQSLFNAKRKVFEARFERARKKRDREPPKAPPIEVFAGAVAELARPPFTSLPELTFPAAPQSAPITARDPQLDSSPTTARDVHVSANAIPFFAGAAAPPAFVAPPAAVAPASVAPATAPPRTAPPATVPRRNNATVSFDLPAIAKPATPFIEKKAAAPAPVAPPDPAPKAAAKRDLGSTWAGEVPTVDVPFRKETPGRAAPAVTVEKPPPATPAPPQPAVRPNETAPIPDSLQKQLREQFGSQKRPNLGATMMADATFLQPTAATPFKQAPPAPPKPSSPAIPAVVQPSPPDDDDDDSPRTKLVDHDLVARVAAQATPFSTRAPQAATAAPAAPTAPLPPAAGGESAASSGPKKFSINVFASLTAEIAENPSDADAIRQRYGISDSEHRAESGRWTAEFAQNAELRQRYLGIVQRYRGYIQQRKGG